MFEEWLSSLYAELRLQIRVENSNFHANLGNTMIYATKDQIEAMTMGDRNAALYGGNIAQVGRPLDLYNHSVDKFAAGIIGAPQMNFLERILDGNLMKLESGMVRDVLVQDASGSQTMTPGVKPEAIGVAFDSQDFHILGGDDEKPLRMDS